MGMISEIVRFLNNINVLSLHNVQTNSAVAPTAAI